MFFQDLPILSTRSHPAPVHINMRTERSIVGKNCVHRSVSNRQCTEDCLWSPAPRQLHPLGRDLTYRCGDILLTVCVACNTTITSRPKVFLQALNPSENLVTLSTLRHARH